MNDLLDNKYIKASLLLFIVFETDGRIQQNL